MAEAKPELQAKALELRRQGWSYRQIAGVVPVAKSTLSLWLRDVPLSDEQRAGLEARRLGGSRSRAAAIRAARIRRTEVLEATAAAEIGALTERELFLLGVVAYWCEGAKAKPWNTGQGVTFINSDPGLVQLFVSWLELLGYDRAEVGLRLSIHESADVTAATRSWAELLDRPAATFQRPTLKRHNPKTTRRNTSESYVGCLVVRVPRSTDLNRRIAGWWHGIRAALPPPAGTMSPPSGVV